MKPTRDTNGLRTVLGKALHLAYLTRSSGAGGQQRPQAAPEWVIVYRTIDGFCCVYHGEPVHLREMLDVQIWAEEMDVQTWFIGL